MKYRRKGLARRITLAAGAAIMSGTLLFGSSYSFAMAQETDSQALDENTAGDTGTSSGNADISSGDAGTSQEDTDTASGNTDTTSGDDGASSKDTDTSSGDPKDSVNYGGVKAVIDAMFAQSGAADCKTLDEVYSSQIDSKKSDKAFLNMVLKLYSIADCDESAVFFKASAYKHAIDPSASSARGMASQAYNKKDKNTALKYFKEAVSLETDNAEKSKLQVKIAAIYKEQGNYTAAREAARTALSYQGSNSKAYIIIGMLYAEYNASISDDVVIKQTAYWAAVDKLEKAKALDPSCAASVNKMISAYKEVFPAKTELFMRNIKEGDTYTVPGWIGEKTTVRGK